MEYPNCCFPVTILWVKGMSAGWILLDGNTDGDLKTRLDKMGLEISKFVLWGFKWWEGNNNWGIPYVISHDRKTWSDKPSYGLSRWCLPCLQIFDKRGKHLLNVEQTKKLEAIIRQYNTDTSSGWSDNYKWRLL